MNVCVFAQLQPGTGLGDLVLRNVLFALIRAAYPGARVTLVIGETDAARFADFLAHHALVDDVMTCPAYEAGLPAGSADEFLPCPDHDRPPLEGTAEWNALIERLRLGRFDACVVDIGSGWLHARTAHDAGIPTRVGVLTGHPDDEHLTAAAPIGARTGDAPDLADLVDAYARALGIQPPPFDAIVPQFPYHPEGPPLTGARPRVALHIGGSTAWNRRWPLANYAALCERLLSTSGGSIVLVGHGEQAEHAQLLASVGAGLDRVGDVSLARTATVLADCDLLAGSDSGPMHVAVALGVPTVTLYGPADGELFWGPVYPNHRRISRHWPCQHLPHTVHHRQRATCEHQCLYPFRLDAPEYPRCVADITVDEVYETVIAELDRARLGAS